MNTRESKLNLHDPFEIQSNLDFTIMQKHGVTHEEVLPHLVRALKSEFGEVLSKHGFFKYWSKKQKYTREDILEELVDMLHFYLSIGNYLDVPYDHIYIEKKKNLFEQSDALEYSLLMVHGGVGWAASFALFRGLVEMMGFNWEDMNEMYAKKNKINYERQENGY
jgi:dimeric dUTPase (all-alpha-NTP-PPase superfamily)